MTYCVYHNNVKFPSLMLLLMATRLTNAHAEYERVLTSSGTLKAKGRIIKQEVRTFKFPLIFPGLLLITQRVKHVPIV